MRRNHRIANKFGVAAIAVLTTFFVALSGQAFAQGFSLGQLLGGGGGGSNGGGGGGGGSGGGSGGGLSQLFGGGSGGGSRPPRNQGSSGGPGIMVDRGAPPFTGKFSGKQSDQGDETTMTAQFACYPASDSDIPQAKTFVCYTGGSNAGSRSSGGPPSHDGGGSYGSSSEGSGYGYGPPNGGPPDGGPPDGGPPNGPPPSVE